MRPRTNGFLAAPLLIIACGGLDPDAFVRKRPKAPAPESAGWVFDAGPRDAGDASGGAPVSRGGGEGQGVVQGGASARGGSDRVDGGEHGEAGHSDGTGGSSMTGGAGARASSGGAGGASAAGRPAAGASVGGHSGTPGQGGRGGSGSPARGGSTAAGASGEGGGAPVPDLYFSEYVEGSSSYKALEIRARADTVLTGCRLVTYFNGAAAGSSIVLDAAVTASTPYVLCSSQLATLLGDVCTRTTNLTFNGDDAIALECGGATIDVVGQIGVDPGDAWGSGDASTLNHTLRRRCPAASDRDGSNAFEPGDAWVAFPVDTFDGLGHADCGD